MNKVILIATLLCASGAASANQWAAHGMRIIQSGGSASYAVIAIQQDGFTSEDLCNDFVLEQKKLADQFRTPNGVATRSLVEAACSQVKQPM